MHGVPSSGHVAYEAMTNAQKAELAAYLRDRLADEQDGSQWRANMTQLIQASLSRRAASGESVDAGDILDEIMPQIRASIPAEVREGLFRRIAAQLNA